MRRQNFHYIITAKANESIVAKFRKNRFSLAPRPQNIKNPFKYLALVGRFSSAAGSTLIYSIEVALMLRYQKIYFVPKFVRYCP